MLNRLEQQKVFLFVVAGPPAEHIHFQKKPVLDHCIALHWKQALLIGRDPSRANVQISGHFRHPSVSRSHCRIEFDVKMRGFSLQDQGSSNGTWVGEKRLAKDEVHVLQHNDEITVGDLQHGGIRFRFSTDAQDSQAERDVIDPALPKTEPIPQLTQDDIDQFVRGRHPNPALSDPEMTGLYQRRKIFLSYSRRNITWMQIIKQHIYDKGFSVLSDEDLAPGTHTWHREIGNMIKQANSLVVLLTPESADSQWVLKELDFAYENGIPILPLFLAGEDTIKPFILSGIQFVDLRDVPFDRVDLRKKKHVQELEKRIIIPLYRMMDS